MKEPDGGAAHGVRVFGGKRRGLVPALGRIAPEDAAGGDGDGRPAFGISARQLPCAVAAQGEAGEIGARRVGVELDGLLIEGGHGHGHHVGVGPVVNLRTLRHHDDEGPALGVVAHRCGQADLRLPHAFGAALAAAVEKEDDGPLPVVVAPPVFGQVDLEAIGDAVELEGAIEEAGFLEVFGMRDERSARARPTGRAPAAMRSRRQAARALGKRVHTFPHHTASPVADGSSCLRQASVENQVALKFFRYS